MGTKLKLGLKRLALAGRAAEHARTALGLSGIGTPLVVADVVPLMVELKPEMTDVFSAYYGPLSRTRKLDPTLLPGEAFVDIFNVGPHGEQLYHHTEARPAWWTRTRIVYAWMVADYLLANPTDVDYRRLVSATFASGGFGS